MSDADAGYLLGIGDFSRFTTLSVRMLRHYDERGLLVPAHVDPHNGYRFYAPAQLKTAGRIRALRDAGCGISQIGTLLPLFDDGDALRAALVGHARRLTVAAQQIADQRALLDTILNQVKESTMPITVSTRTVPAMTVLGLRRIIANYQAEGELWGEFGALVKSDPQLSMADFGKTWGTTFYDDDYKESDVDVAVWGEYLGDRSPAEPLSVIEMPEQQVAYATLYGPYEGTSAVSEAIGAWMAEQGLSLAGPMFNLLIVSPAQDPNPENWVTELNFPVK